jgi:hypothetical protein
LSVTARSTAPDAVDSVAFIVDTNVVWNYLNQNKLISVRNNGSEVFRVRADGQVWTAAGGFYAESGSSNVTLATGVLFLTHSPGQIAAISNTTEGYRLSGTKIGVVGSDINGASACSVILDTPVTYSTAGAKIVSFRNFTVEKLYVGFDGALVHSAWNIGATGQADFNGSVRSATGFWRQSAGTTSLFGRADDGAAAVGVTIDNTTTLATTGAKLVSFKNNTVEKAYITLEGSYVLATGLWDDVPCRAGQAGGISALTLEDYRDTDFKAYFFRHNQDDILYLEWQMPHSWDPATSVRPHVHIIPMVNPASSEVIRFSGKYAWSQAGVALPADVSWTPFAVSHTVETTDEFKQAVVALATVAPPSNPKESNILLMWVMRAGLSDGADTYKTSKVLGTGAANVMVASLDAHYQKVKFGTVAEIP